MYVVPVISILGRLALVPAGDTGIIPYSMRSESALYQPGATVSDEDLGLFLEEDVDACVTLQMNL